MPFDTNLRNTCLFLSIFILAFFPNIFHVLLIPLTYPLSWLVPDFSSIPTPKLPICACCPPASCTPSTSSSATTTMSWTQKTFTLPSKSRGSYLITNDILSSVPEIKNYRVGLVHLFIQHTSCALSLNENWDEDVRADMSDALDRIVPEDKKGTLYRHSCEGPDDMPAHVKSALVGASISVPISEGKLALGTWQGIWYLEFREAKMKRKVVATIQGEKFEGK